MNVKKIWTSNDFDSLDWHDSIIYSVHFPLETQTFLLDIDYLFDWELNHDSNMYSFYVSPCTISFNDTLYLKFNIDFRDSVKLFISEIRRHNERLSPNGLVTLWSYEIETDKGLIEFEASDFTMTVKQQPALGLSQVLGRP